MTQQAGNSATADQRERRSGQPGKVSTKANTSNGHSAHIAGYGRSRYWPGAGVSLSQICLICAALGRTLRKWPKQIDVLVVQRSEPPQLRTSVGGA
jgi:hypothetical protein